MKEKGWLLGQKQQNLMEERVRVSPSSGLLKDRSVVFFSLFLELGTELMDALPLSYIVVLF